MISSSTKRRFWGQGIHQWQLERVLAQMDPLPQAKPKPTQRGDLPVMRPHLKRASLTLALAAAAPNNRLEAMRQFEQDILARSTNPSQESRVRTYRAICKAWGIPAFPMSLETIRCFGASMKAGHYRSVALYYQAAIGFQARRLDTPIEPFLRQRCYTECSARIGSQLSQRKFRPVRAPHHPDVRGSGTV